MLPAETDTGSELSGYDLYNNIPRRDATHALGRTKKFLKIFLFDP